MNMMAPTEIANAFWPNGVLMLAHVRDMVQTELEGLERRDVLSAFKVLGHRLDLDLSTVPATANATRQLFDRHGSAALGVSAKRYANIRSLIGTAVQRFGMRRTRLSSRTPLSLDWEALLDTTERHPYRRGITRLAHYCSAVSISPNEVRSETLLGFHEALEAESMTKHPRKLVKHTIAMWNHFGRTVPGWPEAVLASPFKGEPDTLPLNRFPLSFQADVASWVDRVTNPDPLDLEAPARALRPTTVQSYVVHFRRFGSALVRRGIVALEEIAGLAIFFEATNFRDGIRHFLRPTTSGSGFDTALAYRVASQLRHVARHYVKVEADTQAEIDALCQRLDPKAPRVMGARNRERLQQFDDQAKVRALMAFPEGERNRALRQANAVRRARGIERALAVSLLIHTGLRISNLRTIRPERHLQRLRDRVLLTIPAEEVKNRQELQFELSDATVALLDSFLSEHRPHLPGNDGRYLFPGQEGGPKSDNAMRAAVSEPVKKHCGLTVSPHLYRHFVAKIVVEREPGMAGAVSRHLGHRSLTTTFASYLGTESRAASREFNRLLEAIHDDPDAWDR